MLSGDQDLPDGIGMARLAWTRLPTAEGAATPLPEGSAAASASAAPQDELFVGAVESLDYEVIENYAYREEQAQRSKFWVPYYIMLKWFFALLIGVGTGLAAIFINLAVENFSGWKFTLTFKIIQHSYFVGFLVYILLNLALVFSSVYIITHFAPAAAGSGIPEIKGYLNGVDTHGILLFRTLVGKIFGSIGSVGGGLALGKEGPLVHTGACIASLLGQGGSAKYHLNSRWVQIFESDRDRRDLVTCGCAAGVAAAFRAPVGGVLFALEEVTSWWRSHLMWRVFFTSAVVAVVVRSAMNWCNSGKCGHFGAGGFIIWDISGGQEDYSYQELLPVAIIGVIGGLLGSGSGAGAKRPRRMLLREDERGVFVAPDVIRQRERDAEKQRRLAAAKKKGKANRQSYKKMNPVDYALMRKADWFLANPRVPNLKGGRFWCHEQVHVYEDIYAPFAKSIRPMQPVNVQSLRTNIHFQDVVKLCEKLNLLKLMSLQCDYNREIIMQFFSTLHLGADDNKTIKWMTGTTKCESNFYSFAEVLGYTFAGRNPCGARFNSPQRPDKNQLSDLYLPGGKVGSTQGLRPLYSKFVTLIRSNLAPSGGNNDAIRSNLVNLLLFAHQCATNDDEDMPFHIDVMDYIFHEMYDAMVNKSTIPYAPYIMLLIKDTLEDEDFSEDLVEHKEKKPYVTKKNLAGGFMADARFSQPSRSRAPSIDASEVPKLSWFQRNVLCMNVELHKENYQAYRERKCILDNQQLILHRLNNETGDAPQPSAVTQYGRWNSSTYNWQDMERSLYVPPTPPPQADDEAEDDEDIGDWDNDDDEEDDDDAEEESD